MGELGTSPTRRMRRLGPATPETGAAPGGVGGGWEDGRPAPRDRPRVTRGAAGLTQPGGGARATERCRGGREVSAARPALPARQASTTGGGLGLQGDGQRAAALAATGPQQVKNRGGGGSDSSGRGTDSPRLRLQAPGPAPSAAARLAPPPPPTAGVKLGPPSEKAGALAFDWPWRHSPRPLPRPLFGRGAARARWLRRGTYGAECWRSWCPTAAVHHLSLSWMAGSLG